jgi:acyl dehydratase
MSIALEDLRARAGSEIGVSSWHRVTQEEIDRFADATGDHQFIHVDPERAIAETPFGGTIAHGFLTLSRLSAFLVEALPPLRGWRMGVNYGFDRVRFLAPVRSGARIRARFVLRDCAERAPGEVMLRCGVTVEIDGSAKPALTAEWITLALLEA